MAESRRLLIATLAGLVIFSLIPHSNAETVEPTDIEIHLNALEDYYLSGDEITFSPNLYNPSDTIQIDNNPSCDYTFDVYDINNLNIYSSSDNCRNQVQSLQLHSGEQLNLMAHTWDFLDNSGLEIASGTYQVTITHSILEISDTTAFNYFAASTIPNDLELRYNLVDISSDSSRAYLLQTFIHNPSEQKADLLNLDCNIVLENSLYRHVFSNCLRGFEFLQPFENLNSGNIVIDDQWLELSDTFSIYLAGQIDNKRIIELNSATASSHEESDRSKINLANIGYRTSEIGANPRLSITAEYEPNSNEEIEDCQINLFVVSDLGEITLTESIDFCIIAEQSKQEVNSNSDLEIYSWDLTKDDGCLVDFGRYTIIVEGKDYHSTEYFQNLPNDSAMCIRNNPNINLVNEIADGSLYTTLTIDSESTIRVVAECMFAIDVAIMSDADYNFNTEYCDFNSGNFLTLSSDGLKLQKRIQLPDLADSETILVTSKISFEQTSAYSDTIYINSGQVGINPNLIYTVNGVWSSIDLDSQQCWMISAPNSAYILQENRLESIWSPKQDWYGEYSVTEQQADDGVCSQFGLPVVTVNNVYMEASPFEDIEPVTTSNQDDSESISIAEVGVIGVASSSILLGLLIFVSNTESLRIPVTSAGLWMLALVGKTHETSDGRFQRGRLIGYLTANPGCHFRALMAALKMSNGQITHHLRLLETQELIWRINDGRFVRYYPLNNSLYPGMNPDDLPVPPLSPDPRSLQGKILTILDDEHQLGEFPTQAELAKKLEKSQQLISHHLRTLQKYGLVEKRKMGIKNRYKLTKEALFLLETDIEYLKVRD